MPQKNNIAKAEYLYSYVPYPMIVRDPINWLLNQKEERKIWENNRKSIKEIIEPLHKYKEFMYNNFPPDFHNKLIFHFLDNSFGRSCKCESNILCKEIQYILSNKDYKEKYIIYLKILQIKRRVATLAKQRLLNKLNILLHIKELPNDEWNNNYFQKIDLISCNLDELHEIYYNILKGIDKLCKEFEWLTDFAAFLRDKIANKS
jgi:hypothetical protein